jgi:hypothetical protein
MRWLAASPAAAAAMVGRAVALVAVLACAICPAQGATGRKSKEQWKEALLSWQEEENQQFMREYEQQQQERARIREKNLPRFDPTNPKAYIRAMSSRGGMGQGGAGGTGGGNPDGAQITFVRLKPGAMKSKADTEELVLRWRDLLTTVGLAAYPHVLSRDQVLMNTQEGWRVPDIQQFALEQPEVKYFEHSGQKWYAEGIEPDPEDASGALSEEEEEEEEQARAEAEAQAKAKSATSSSRLAQAQRSQQQQVHGRADAPREAAAAAAAAAGGGLAATTLGDAAAAAQPLAAGAAGGWSVRWGGCSGCRRACGSAAALSACTIDRVPAERLDPAEFKACPRPRRHPRQHHLPVASLFSSLSLSLVAGVPR